MFLPYKAGDAFASIYWIINNRLTYNKLAHDIAIKKTTLTWLFFRLLPEASPLITITIFNCPRCYV